MWERPAGKELRQDGQLFQGMGLVGSIPSYRIFNYFPFGVDFHLAFDIPENEIGNWKSFLCVCFFFT